MDLFLNLFAAGLVIGSVYGLIAMGFAIIYRATGMLNFAQGETMMLVAYVTYSVASIPGAGLLATVTVALVVGIAAGVVLEFLFIRPMAGEPMFSKVMVTIALAVIIRALIVLAWGHEPLAVPRLLGQALIEIGPVVLYSAQVAVIVALVVACALTWVLFTHSRTGIAMRAAANDEAAALLMGIHVKRVHAIAWGAAGAYAALAGLACAFMFNVDPGMSALGLRAFPAAILGGLDSVLGAAIGGIVVGVLENFAATYLGRGMKDVVGFILIVVVLMVRPYGLFGTRRIERV